jgi:SAM-dependent methyltransferase
MALGHHTSNGQHHDHGDANSFMNSRSLDDLVKSFESPERAEWQKPDQVIRLLGNLHDKTVMDIGSGTGYFSFRLVKAGAKVICADIDERFLDYIRERAEKESSPEGKIELRLVEPHSPNLKENEVDAVLIVNTYHHIHDRVPYLEKILDGLRPTGKLMIVDFIKEELPVGPPVEMKLTAEHVSRELREAGFQQIVVNRELLPYQYIVEGVK